MNSMSSIQSDAVPMNHMAYRRFLKTLDDGLGSDDCNKLCFIVADVGIPKSKLEKCRYATDIFDELEKRSYIAANDVGLLWTLMDLIHRKDLLREFESFRNAIKFARPINASGMISDFRLLLLKIADETNGADLGQIKYACSDLLGRQALSKCRDIYQIFSLLEERGMIGPTNLDFLIELLHLVQNYDIVAKVLEFKEKQTPSAPRPTDEELAKLSSKLGNEWQQLATYLGITYHKIQAINHDVRLTEDKIRSMLFAWRQHLSSQDNSYAILAIALRKCGRVDIAEVVKSWSVQHVKPAPSPLPRAGPIAHPTQPDNQYVPPERINLMKPSYFCGPVFSTPSFNTGFQELGGSGDYNLLDRTLRELSEHIVVEWMKLGTYLKLEYSMLMRIDRDYHNSDEKAYAMLMTWYQGLPRGTDALGTLASVLKVVGRLDLSERIKGIKSPTIYLEKQLKPTIGQPASETTSETIPENITEVKQPETDIKTEPMDVSPANVSPAPATAYFPQQESFPQYRMNRNPRGRCMIINNEQFSKLKKREGSEIDAGKLDNLFSKLHFEVQVRNNLTSHEMVQWFKKVSMLDHSEYDCFACCIMSHGELGVVYGSDDEKVEIQDILSHFKPVSCRSLKNKPKLFFIQACQGTVSQEGVDLQTDDTPGMGSGMPKTLPNEADFLLSYATVPGYTAFRSRTKGSWYVNALVDGITKHHNELDLIRILVRVNDSLSDYGVTGKNVKQIPAPSYSLRKDVYLLSLDE